MGGYSHYLVRTAFHGGGVVSMHWSEATALRKRAKYLRGVSCTCGCVVVVTQAEYASLRRASEDGINPYGPAQAR